MAAAGALVSALRPELERARWYQGKGRELVSLRLVERVQLPEVAGGLLAIMAAEYADGSVAEYAIPATVGCAGAVELAGPTDPVWSALARLAANGGSIEGEHGTVVAVPESPPATDVAWRDCRPLQADQSNTSVVVGGRVVLKLYRRLRPGKHPEQELLAGLTRVRSKCAPVLIGSIEYRRSGSVTALATAYAHVEGTPVGWEPAIATLTAALGGPVAELDRLAAETAAIGRCAGELHRDLLAAFGGRLATRSSATAEHERAAAGLDEAIQVTCPLAPELEALGPAARAEFAPLERLEGTRLQRIHGDLHIGQLLRTPAGIVAIDFEGDPTLPTEARRGLASPLQDVASLLLSLDHVAAAAARRRGFGAATDEAFAWSAQARDTVIAAYDAAAGASGDPGLLRALEVSKEWREAVYAARVLPEWLYAPRLVLQKLLA
jgi:maltokinase